MDNHWYSRQYLGRSFDIFLKSKMNLKDFTLLQQELQQVLVQLQESNNFIESGYPNKIGKTHTRQKEEKEKSHMNRQQIQERGL